MTVTYMFKAARGDAAKVPMPAAPGVLVLEAPVSPLEEDAPGAGRIAPTDDPPAPDAERAAAGARPGTDVAVTEPRNLPVKWQPPASRLILVAKSRGGVGATSVAVNLALELQKGRRVFGTGARRRVALVDFDVQFGNVGSFLDLEDRGGALELLRLAEEPDPQAVRNAMLTHSSGLKVLVAPRMAVPLEALDIRRVESILSALMAEYDYVVADLPPALVPWLEPLLVRAMRLLMVSDLAVPSIACTRRVLDLMREDNPELPAEIVVSRERKPLIQRKVHREAATAIGLPLTHWLPDEPKLARQALDRGEPLALLAPRCAWTKSVRQIATSIEAVRLVGNEGVGR
jgi:pilus assembly protein CpaE